MYGCLHFLRSPKLSVVCEAEAEVCVGRADRTAWRGYVYVGRQGDFDDIVLSVLRELADVYPRVSYNVVLERLPGKRDDPALDLSITMFPEGLEFAPPRFAISWRNEWMLKQSDYVVTYVTHGWGGAAQFAEKAKRQGKAVIDLA